MQNRQGDVKNSRGNGEAKELICTTHRHELRGGLPEGMGVLGGGGKGRNWDNCNSIVNKMFFKKGRGGIYTMEHYSAIKKRKSRICNSAMDLEGVTLSETSRLEDKCPVTSLKCGTGKADKKPPEPKQAPLRFQPQPQFLSQGPNAPCLHFSACTTGDSRSALFSRWPSGLGNTLE